MKSSSLLMTSVPEEARMVIVWASPSITNDEVFKYSIFRGVQFKAEPTLQT